MGKQRRSSDSMESSSGEPIVIAAGAGDEAAQAQPTRRPPGGSSSDGAAQLGAGTAAAAAPAAGAAGEPVEPVVVLTATAAGALPAGGSRPASGSAANDADRQAEARAALLATRPLGEQLTETVANLKVRRPSPADSLCSLNLANPKCLEAVQGVAHGNSNQAHCSCMCPQQPAASSRRGIAHRWMRAASVDEWPPHLARAPSSSRSCPRRCATCCASWMEATAQTWQRTPVSSPPRSASQRAGTDVPALTVLQAVNAV